MRAPDAAANSLARPHASVPAGASDWSEQVGRVWRADARSFPNQGARIAAIGDHHGIEQTPADERLAVVVDVLAVRALNHPDGRVVMGGRHKARC